jgi:hypothetical protein
MVARSHGAICRERVTAGKIQVQLIAIGAEIKIADAQIGLAGKVPQLAAGESALLRRRKGQTAGSPAILLFDVTQAAQPGSITQFPRLFD